MNGMAIQKLLVSIGLMWLFYNALMAAILWALFDGLGLSKSPVRVFLVLSTCIVLVRYCSV